jgi:uncharacterized metal-binding protein YceD (DUF177 family)
MLVVSAKLLLFSRGAFKEAIEAMNDTSHNRDSERLPMNLFTIDVTRIVQQSEFDWQLPQSWLAGLLSQCEYPVEAISGRFSGTIKPDADMHRLQGTLDFKVETECATCLSKLKLDLCAHIDTFMQPASKAIDSREELTSDDLEIEYYDGPNLVLDELIGDSILLELPMIPRCENACRKIDGLVTAAELDQIEQTVDPRLKALANIKLSKEN